MKKSNISGRCVIAVARKLEPPVERWMMPRQDHEEGAARLTLRLRNTYLWDLAPDPEGITGFYGPRASLDALSRMRATAEEAFHREYGKGRIEHTLDYVDAEISVRALSPQSWRPSLAQIDTVEFVRMYQCMADLRDALLDGAAKRLYRESKGEVEIHPVPEEVGMYPAALCAEARALAPKLRALVYDAMVLDRCEPRGKRVPVQVITMFPGRSRVAINVNRGREWVRCTPASRVEAQQ